MLQMVMIMLNGVHTVKNILVLTMDGEVICRSELRKLLPLKY